MRGNGGRELKSGRAIGLLLALLVLAGVGGTARGDYAGTVLYPLLAPAGDTGAMYLNAGDDTGQIAGTIGLNSVLWPGSSASVNVDPGVSFLMLAISGSQLAGHNGTGAYIQNGVSGPGVDLSPGGFNYSEVLSTNGTQQVGVAATSVTGILGLSSGDNAYVWNGSLATAVDLNPAGFNSAALGTNGTQQVGEGAGAATGNKIHALLWSGSSAYVDLNPTGFAIGSVAYAIYGNQEVGDGAPPGTNPLDTLAGANVHALEWSGSAASYVDLNPDGILMSEAVGTNGTQQIGVGFVTRTSSPEAFLWNGSADSAVNLESLLPSNDTWTTSWPYGIDPSGNVFGYAEDSSGNYFAVEWSAVPEPAAGGLLAMACAGGLLRRRKASRQIKVTRRCSLSPVIARPNAFATVRDDIPSAQETSC